MEQDSVTVSAALEALGVVDPAAVRAARNLLDEVKLTNPHRDRVSAKKLERLREALAGGFAVHCAGLTCTQRALAGGRPGLLVRKDACPICAGSNTHRAVQDMLDACSRAGIRSVCLVGGSPSLRQEWERQAGVALRLTLVDGTRTPSSAQARAHMRGHDLVVICGSSELDHKVSNTYESAARESGQLITVNRRGAEAIANAITFHAQQRSRK